MGCPHTMHIPSERRHISSTGIFEFIAFELSDQTLLYMFLFECAVLNDIESEKGFHLQFARILGQQLSRLFVPRE